jgi:excisionase family DNA binding protein
LFAPTEAARYLVSRGVQCSTASIKRWVDIGSLRGVRTAAGRRLVPRHELDRWLAVRRDEECAVLKTVEE